MSVKFDNRRGMLEGKIAIPQLRASSPHITKVHPIMGTVVLPWHTVFSLRVASHGEGQKLRSESKAVRPLNMDLSAMKNVLNSCAQWYTAVHIWSPSIGKR